jgi:FkbM family methyltransferase
MNTNLNEKIFSFFHRFIEKNYHSKKLARIIKNMSNAINPTIFDVGGNEGESIELFINTFRQPKIYSFEPEIGSFQKLQEQYGKINEINLFNLAFGNKKEILNLKINVKSSTSTFSTINTKSKYYKLKSLILNTNKNKIFVDEESVQVETIDNFCIEKKIQNIEILKIDTEGFELNVLEGAKESLQKTNIIIIEFQLNDMYLNYNPKKIEDILKKNNFTLMKSLKFPFMQYEDRIYINQDYK